VKDHTPVIELEARPQVLLVNGRQHIGEGSAEIPKPRKPLAELVIEVSPRHELPALSTDTQNWSPGDMKTDPPCLVMMMLVRVVHGRDPR
jgi:hypothetical protein